MGTVCDTLSPEFIPGGASERKYQASEEKQPGNQNCPSGLSKLLPKVQDACPARGAFHDILDNFLAYKRLCQKRLNKAGSTTAGIWLRTVRKRCGVSTWREEPPTSTTRKFRMLGAVQLHGVGDMGWNFGGVLLLVGNVWNGPPPAFVPVPVGGGIISHMPLTLRSRHED